MHIQHFHEEQRFRQWWVWLLIGVIVVIQWWAFIGQIIFDRPWGSRPASDGWLVVFWLLFGVAMPLFILYLKLIVTVTDQAVTIQFRPLSKRTIPIDRIVEYEARTYSPMREYGGWGIRGWRGNRAYNVSGNRGVRLTLANGDKITVGSRRPEELARAIAVAKRITDHPAMNSPGYGTASGEPD